MPNAHKLKVQLAFFDELVSGKKTFELRKNDRNFSTGDVLILEEYDVSAQAYTGRRCQKEVTYLLESIPEFGLMDGFCIMGLKENVTFQQQTDDSGEPQFQRRDKVWLNAHVGCTLKFKVNGVDAEGTLDYNRSLGIHTLEFFGGKVNADLALISPPISA